MNYSAVVAFVGTIISLGVVVPWDSKYFAVFGIAGALSGFILGQTLGPKIMEQRKIVAAFISLLFLCLGFVTYNVVAESGDAGFLFIFKLAVLLAISFGCLTFLIVLAGVNIKKP